MSGTATILQLALGTTVHADDVLEYTDIHDSTDDPAGTSKRTTAATLFTSRTAVALTVTTSLTVTGTATISSTLDVAGNFSVATSKLTVAAATGNTAIAGTLSIAGLLSANAGVTVAGVGLTLNGVNALPAADNSCTLGSASYRFADIRSFLGTFTNTLTCGNGLIVTGASRWSSGLGYAAGQGAAVTQTSSTSNGVTINTYCGQITTQALNLAAAATASFTVTNSTVAANDSILLTLLSTPTFTGSYCKVRTVAAGSFVIDLVSAGTTESATWIIQFSVLKSVKA